LEGDVEFSVSGHYHMNRGGNDFQENIPENAFRKRMYISVGAGQYGMAGVLLLRGEEAKYNLLKIE